MHRAALIRRLVVPVVATLAVAAGSVALWSELKRDSEAQIARIAEAESYAARSQLSRSMETALTALASVQMFWETFGHLPRNQWASDAGIELEHVEGMEMLAWDDPAKSIRYLRTPDNPVFDFRPSEEEWLEYGALLNRAHNVAESGISYPYTRKDGRVFFEIYILSESTHGDSRLIAVIDAARFLNRLLKDDSPGYAVQVLWGETVLYRRGTPASDVPEDWSREGLIKLSLGPYWKVVHIPEQDLVRSIRSPAVDSILVLGLVIAVLIGALIFENGRAKMRAVSAEAAEDAVRELNRSLDYQVASRTEELAQRTADLQTITDSVAHDLRNPLNAIAVNVELIAQQYGEQLGLDGQTITKRISLSVRQMAEILDRLLGLSRVTHSTFKPEIVDMQKLVSEIAEELQATEQPPPVTIAIGDLPETHADKSLVHILLTNLLSNALKYTREKPERRIEVGFQVESGTNIYFVKDNGVGFSNEAAQRLFVAFHRADNNTITDGIGLGLTIASRVVARHRGTIWAEGRPDEGATFFFTLGPPIERDDAIDD